ncbi:MAG: DUF72 domain-containing protein [Terriglobales bacterium]
MNLRIGTAGWAYKDWNGIVYPDTMKRAQHPVEYLAQYFDTIEINTSFYGNLKPEVAKLWCRKASAVNPQFVFTAKLNKCFTHSPNAVLESTSAATIRFTPADVAEAKEGYDALADEGRLGALLLQFPISFKNTNENRDHVDVLLAKFREYRLAVEVRHASWANEGTLRYFAEKEVAFCNIDQPQLGRAVAPSQHVTSRIAYVRLHGRNYDQWFEADKPHDRYNYLYTEQELQPWKSRIEQIAQKAEVTFVVANNHFEGKAAVNALQLKSMIAGAPVKAPEVLVRHYPQLQKFVAPQDPALFSKPQSSRSN